MPAGVGAHVQRKVDLPAGYRRSFRNEFRLNPARLRHRGREQKRQKKDQAAEHVSLCP
jgi:hypothetical protein